MKLTVLSLLAILFFACSSNQKETKIYQWRGENRAGIYLEENLLDKWPDEGPKEIWSTEILGSGYGSPTITDEIIFITGTEDSTAVLFCFDLQGELLWQTDYGLEWVVNFPGSRSAPTVVDDMVYVGSGRGNLYCINTAGQVVWSKDFVDDFQGQMTRFGVSEAALVDGDMVFWTPGGEEHNVVALNRFTGDLVWSCKAAGERPGYNSPLLIELPTRKLLVTFTAYNLVGIDVATGELLWKHEQDNTPLEKRSLGRGDTHGNTAVFDDGFIYYAAGDGNCGVKLELSEDGSSIKEVWRNKGFDCYMGGIVKLGDVVYGCGTRKKDLKAINATSGIMTDSLKIGSGSIIEADNRIYYYNQKGEVNLIDYSKDSMEVISSFKIEKGTQEHFAHPVIADGVLYIRRGSALIAYDIKDPA